MTYSISSMVVFIDLALFCFLFSKPVFPHDNICKTIWGKKGAQRLEIFAEVFV